MRYTINMDFPGSTTEDEISDVCDIITVNGFSDIFSIGSLGGRLVWALCTNFPNSFVTAIDNLGPGIDWPSIRSENLTCGQQYNDIRLTEAWFASTHRFPNLDFFNHELQLHKPELCNILPDRKHDLVVVETDLEHITFEDTYDKALSLSPSMVLGFVRNHQPIRNNPVLNGYECTLLTPRVVWIHSKR